MRSERFRVRPGERAVLKRIRPDDRSGFDRKTAALARLAQDIARVEALQNRLYAQDQYALLLIFQGMDAAGKDSAIKHVMSGVNPQGTDVHAFKQPSSEELSHDFLWRAARVLPARGRIGIFNRSYYEEVLVVRVHPELLAEQRLPSDRVTPRLWRERFADINVFEQHLWRSGTIVRKFFLHLSADKQRERFLERLDDPTKNWKFSIGDLAERARWKAYMAAYQEMLGATSTDHAPWYVIPADHKGIAHALIADVIVKTLDALDLAYPRLGPKQRRDLAQARRQLKRER